MMATQYYGMPGATPPSWGVYSPQNAMISGQQTPTPGTPQPAMLRSQTTRSVTPHQQPQQDGMTAAQALHTPGEFTESYSTRVRTKPVKPSSNRCPIILASSDTNSDTSV